MYRLNARIATEHEHSAVIGKSATDVLPMMTAVVTLQALHVNICLCVHADVSSAGYKYLASRMKEEEEPGAEQKAQEQFLEQLDVMEARLDRHAGPYLVGCAPFPPSSHSHILIHLLSQATSQSYLLLSTVAHNGGTPGILCMTPPHLLS